MPETRTTGADYMNDAARFPADCLRAVKAFARSKPWQGTQEERAAKLRMLNAALALVYNIQPPLLTFVPGHGCAGRADTILIGDLSVVSYLHAFARVRGMGDVQATGWSLNLFKRCFPRSFAACRFVGIFLVCGEVADAVDAARLDAEIAESARADEADPFA